MTSQRLFPYEGTALGSRDAAHWKVRVFDADGEPSKWSDDARFEMGLLDPADWVADWTSVARPPAGESDRKIASVKEGDVEATTADGLTRPLTVA